MNNNNNNDKVFGKSYFFRRKKNKPLSKNKIKTTANVPNKTKRILCYNMLNSKICKYQSKCMYAHGLDDQRRDPIRDKVYTMLKEKTNFSKINLVVDKKLFNTFMSLTKVCKGCAKQICTGGYNCRDGAISNKYKICYDDIMYGTCKRINCKAIHLTERGLKPYILQDSIHNNKSIKKNDNTIISNLWKNEYRKKAMMKNFKNNTTIRNYTSYKNSINNDNSDNCDIDTSVECNRKYTDNFNVEYNKKYTDNFNEITGIPLTENFFLSILSKKHHNDYVLSIDSDSDDDDDVAAIRKYLDADDDEDNK